MKTHLSALARAAVTKSDFKAFADALSTQSLPDSFGVLTDPELAMVIAQQLGDSDATRWVTRALTWNADVYDPSLTMGAADQLLHLLWQDLSTRLARKLDATSRRTPLAPKGAVLCFFGRAQFSLVVEYVRSGGGAVRLRPLATLREPNGVFELTTLLDGSTPEIRNAIKNAALSVDKLVFQRGCVIHVDRQREDVFGPTIDTVILGELLAEWLNAQPTDRKLSSLEIGPGSGLLSTLLASSDRVGELTAVDLNGAAVSCTLKNLQINDVSLDTHHQRIRVRAERFSPDQFTTSVDIIVCNPPYIPEAPDSTSSLMKEYDRAVGGLELCTQLLQALPRLLSPDGVLLLMASSLSYQEVLESVPEGFVVTPALGGVGRRVPLDVDVVWQRTDWQDRLLNDRKIEQDGHGGLCHHLRPLWIKRNGRSL